MKMQGWISSARPKTLFAGISPVLVGLSLAYHLQGYLHWRIAFLTLSCTICLQLGTNLVNDYFDSKDKIDGPERLGPKRGIHLGVLTPREVYLASIGLFALAGIQALWLILQGGGAVIFLLASLSLAAAYLYTGGPYPLSRYPLGEFTAWLFFGPIAVWGTLYLQLQKHQSEGILLGISLGFMAAAIMAINNLRDRESDRLNSKKTLATYLSAKGARSLPLFFIFFAHAPLLLYFLKASPSFLIVFLLLQIPFIPIWKKIALGPIDATLNIALGKTGLLTFLMALCLSVGILLQDFNL